MASEAGELAAGLKAVVTGGTGAIGKHLVAELLQDTKWSRVVTVGRKRVELSESYGADVAVAERTGKLVQHVIDMDKLDEHASLFDGHDASFCTLGTTRGDAGSAVSACIHSR